MPPGVMGGGSDGGAVLAAIDFGAVESSPAAPAGALSGGYHVQLEALRKIHAQKVRTLMRSVAELKKRLALATAQGKDHRRSAMIRAMRTRLREQALVIDVVKEEMGLKAGVGKEEINDWVIRKTVGGPLRFRPKTREELQNELYRLEKKHRQALDKLKARRTGRGNYEGDGRDAKENRSHPELASQSGDPGAGIGHDGGAGADLQKEDARTTELMRLSDALEEVDALRVSVRSRDSALQTQAEEIDQLQLELRELGGIQERLERNERRVRDLKSKNAHLAEQHTSLLEDFEACQEQIHHLKAQLALRKEEALAVADEFQEQSLRQAEEVGVILKREEELTTALEEEVASRHRERREHHHTDRQAVARAEAAEKRLLAAEKQARRLGEQNATMLAEIQRLGSEAAEAAGLRERGRELAVEKKRLATEAEARQGRLEEARERGATAEEALRASKEFLEAEKLSKETLTREVSEVRVLLDQERALLEAERNKSNDEAEARRRLESLLVAERKKEEDMGIAAAKAAAEASSKIAAANAATAAAMAQQAAAVKGETKMLAEAALDNNNRRSSEGGERIAKEEEEEEAIKRRYLAESEEIIEEMESELREQADRITTLDADKDDLKIKLESAIKVTDELRAKNAALTAQRNAAVSTATAASAAAIRAEAEATSSKKVEELEPRSSPRCSSAQEAERILREQLTPSKIVEESVHDECPRLKEELEDASASSELQKVRIKELVAKRDLATIEGGKVDDRTRGDNMGAETVSEVRTDP